MKNNRKKKNNFYREEDGWDYLAYGLVLAIVGLFIFLLMV